ncbi:unnamed protein product, partial [Heterosigma akashiwo]
GRGQVCRRGPARGLPRRGGGGPVRGAAAGGPGLQRAQLLRGRLPGGRGRGALAAGGRPLRQGPPLARRAAPAGRGPRALLRQLDLPDFGARELRWRRP